MMTVVAFVKLIPNPPALVEIKKTWYAVGKTISPQKRRIKDRVRDFSCWNLGAKLLDERE